MLNDQQKISYHVTSLGTNVEGGNSTILTDKNYTHDNILMEKQVYIPYQRKDY